MLPSSILHYQIIKLVFFKVGIDNLELLCRRGSELISGIGQNLNWVP